MSGITVPVAPGKQPTQLTGAPLVQGATIYNQDTVNGVWVSSSSNVSPGNGQFIGPLGNAQWNNDNSAALAYACVDTGVTSAVSLVLSSDMSGMSNPVSLAAATASLLLTNGVLNVFQGKLIENIALPLGNGSAVNHTVPGDLSQFASVSINLQAIGPQQRITFTWLTAPGGLIVSQKNYLATGLLTNLGSDLQISLTVEAPTLRIDFPFGSSTLANTSIIVYASTRDIVPTVGKLDLAVDYKLNQAWTTGTVYNMGVITTNGGLHSMRMLTPGAGTAFFGYLGTDSGGNNIPSWLFKTAAGQDAYGSFLLPRGCIELIALTNVVASYQAEFAISPAGS